MEYGKIHRLETLIILQITQAQLPASFQEGEPMKDQKTDTGDRQQQSSSLTDILAPKKILSLMCHLKTIMYDCELFAGVYYTRDPCRPGASNSHTKPMPRRFYEPVYFQTHFRANFPTKKKRISTIRGRRYQKGKLNAKKKIIFRSVSFADLFVEFKRYSVFTPKPF